MPLPGLLKAHKLTIKKAPAYTESFDVMGLMVPSTRSPYRSTVAGASADLVMHVFVEPDVDLSIRDLIIWQEREFIVEGEVIPVPDPLDLSRLSHKEATLKEYR